MKYLLISVLLVCLSFSLAVQAKDGGVNLSGSSKPSELSGGTQSTATPTSKFNLDSSTPTTLSPPASTTKSTTKSSNKGLNITQAMCGDNPITVSQCTSDNAGTWIETGATSSSSACSYAGAHTFHKCCRSGYASEEYIMCQEQYNAMQESLAELWADISDALDDLYNAWNCSTETITEACNDALDNYYGDIFGDCINGNGIFEDSVVADLRDNNADIVKDCCEENGGVYDGSEKSCSVEAKDQEEADSIFSKINDCIDEKNSTALNESLTAYCRAAADSHYNASAEFLSNQCNERLAETDCAEL